MRSMAGQIHALDTLREVADKFPDLRVCQLIVNATGRSDPFYVEDETPAEALLKYAREHGR